MKKRVFIFCLLIQNFVLAENTIKFEEHEFQNSAPCINQNILSIAESSINLLREIKPAISNNPAFCREYTSPGDDENDEILKNEVKKLIKNSKPSETEYKPTYYFKNQTLEVLRMVAMKKMWSTMGENARLKTFISHDCANEALNKWPVIVKYKNKKSNDKEEDEKVKNMKTLCGSTSSNNLGKFLTRDVIAESFEILKKLNESNFKQVINTTCEIFANTDETIYKQEVYKDYVLDNEEIKNKEEFVNWLIKTSQHKVSLKLYGSDNLKGKISDIFRKLNRKEETIDKILTTDEREAFYSYVGNGYIAMNVCLRTGTGCENAQKSIDLLKSGLKKLKKARGTDEEQLLFRGARNLPNFILDNLKDGAQTGKSIILDKAFVSTSGQVATAMSFGEANYETTSDKNNIFVVKAKSCVSVDNYVEDEFLCPPGIKFKVKLLKEKGLYQLDEVEEVDEVDEVK